MCAGGSSSRLAAAVVTVLGWCPAARADMPPIPEPGVRIEFPNGLLGRVVLPVLQAYRAGPTEAGEEWLARTADRLLVERPDGRYVYHERRGTRGWYTLVGWGVFTILNLGAEADADHARLVEIHARAGQVLIADQRRAAAALAALRGGVFGDAGTAERAMVERLGRLAAPHAGRVVHGLVAYHGWFLFTRWPTDDPTGTLVSLRDIAFSIGDDLLDPDIRNWWRAWDVDWTADRFTLLYAGHRLTFTAGSTEALLDGEPRVLRGAPERIYYDLYVPLADLAELLGGEVREAREDELTVYRENLPVTIYVLDLPDQ